MEQPVNQPLNATDHSGSGITLRSLLIGTICVMLVGLITPYNNFVLSDTSLSSGFLPLFLVLIQFVLIVFINAPLHRFKPRLALTGRELAVIVLMTALVCGLSDWGLMRFFIPTPVAPFYNATLDSNFFKAFQSLKLPGYLFPVQSIENGATDPVAVWFYRRMPEGASIPWNAWIKPLFFWGIFVAAMIATLVSIGRMIIGQWLVNERLPFPLVQVQTSLIEPPESGRMLNPLLRSPGLWIGLGLAFFIQLMNGLHVYVSEIPAVPLKYDFSNIMVDPPFSFLRPDVKAAQLSFMVIGATYFIRSRAAFSLWGLYIIVSIVEMTKGAVFGMESNSAALQDQHLGGCLAFMLGTAWIGRHHWKMILRNAFGTGESSVYRTTFFIAVAGLLTMFLWLIIIAQVHVWMAMLIISIILIAHIIVSRVVAETGLPSFRSSVSVLQVYTNLPVSMVSQRDVYFAGVFNLLGPLNTRDGLMTHTQQGLGVTRSMGIDRNNESKLGWIIGWALIIGAVCTASSMLWCHYNYPTPVERTVVPQGNNFGAVYVPKRDIFDHFMNYQSSAQTGKFPPKSHTPWLHFSGGFVVTCFLEVASLRWASWPLMPVGFITSYGSFMGNVWFSIFIGWVFKSIIVRFGGASVMQKVRSFFVGIIFGEALAAAVFLLVNAIVVWNGYESQTVKFIL